MGTSPIRAIMPPHHVGLATSHERPDRISIALAAVGCKTTSAPVELGQPTSPAPAITPRPLSVEPKTYLDGVQLPVSLQFAPDGRLFFVEVNKGQVRVAQNGVLRESPLRRWT